MMVDLIKIIKQAEENGFDLWKFCLNHDAPYTGLYHGIIRYLLSKNLVDLLLLNKEFNKCYWGEKKIEVFKCTIGINPLYIKYVSWEYHLQMAVLRGNKVEYFKRGLKEWAYLGNLVSLSTDNGGV